MEAAAWMAWDLHLQTAVRLPERLHVKKRGTGEMAQYWKVDFAHNSKLCNLEVPALLVAVMWW